MQLELAALREVRSKTGLSRISHGYNRRSTSDLDEDTMREVRANNAAVKAMFESAGPKYKFGGGGGSALASKSEADLRPTAVRRPSLRPREERGWVLDSINKYFDVIVEEDGDDEDDDANEEVFYPDSGEDGESDADSVDIPGLTGPLQMTASKRDLRSMFQDAMSRVSARVGGSREVLVGRFKQNLGSQLSIDE